MGSTAATWATAGDTNAPFVVGAIGLVGLGATVIAVNTDREVANGGNVAVTPIVTNSVTFLASTVAAGVVTAGAGGE